MCGSCEALLPYVGLELGNGSSNAFFSRRVGADDLKKHLKRAAQYLPQPIVRQGHLAW